MTTLPITTAASMQALTQLRALSAMSSVGNGKTNNAATTLFGPPSTYGFNVDTLTASSDASGYGSGSLATGVVALSNLKSVLTGLQSLSQSAADANTSSASRSALQGQYNSLLQQADSLVSMVGANGITLKSLTSSASDAVASNAAGLGLSSASWTQASDATANQTSAAAALSEVNGVLSSFASSASASYAVRATLQSSELTSMFGDGGNADLTQEIASLSGLTTDQSLQSIQNFLSDRKSALITSA